jgi:hypothetical protein
MQREAMMRGGRGHFEAEVVKRRPLINRENRPPKMSIAPPQKVGENSIAYVVGLGDENKRLRMEL